VLQHGLAPIVDVAFTRREGHATVTSQLVDS
jgi:hypothetical protein